MFGFTVEWYGPRNDDDDDDVKHSVLDPVPVQDGKAPGLSGVGGLGLNGDTEHRGPGFNVDTRQGTRTRRPRGEEGFSIRS